MNIIFQKKNVEKKVLEKNKDTIRAQKSDSCINGQKGVVSADSRTILWFFAPFKAEIRSEIFTSE